MKQKKNKGISLIVLIITMVVIIILGTAIVVNLAETNIIGNSNEAVVKQDFKTFESELDLYIADEYTELKGKLDVTTIDATTKEDVAKIIPSIKGSRYEEYVTIVDGKIVVSDEMPEEQKEWANEALGSTTTSEGTPVIAVDTEVTTSNSTITGKNFEYNNPVIPIGFKAINTDDASWDVDENGIILGWNDGLVIQDASGNEFVWVPCTLDGANGTIKYEKWCTSNIEYNHSYISVDTYALPNKNENEKIDETEQIATYGGFYIGRYEAGVPANQTAIDGSSSSTSNKTGIPVIQQGANVWTNINYVNSNVSAKSYKDTTNLKSGIVTGTAWDTVCAWIQSETDSEGNIIHDVNSSANWGNHEDSISPANITGYGLKQVAGFSEVWKAKNIYDIAGNLSEWTGEYYGVLRVFRSGTFYYTISAGGSAASRYTTRAETPFEYLSFRVMLYVM